MSGYTYGQESSRLGSLASVLTLSLRLFQRTIGAKYRKSFLGYFWMVFPALLITGGVSMASRAGIINPGQIDLSYPLYVLMGTLVWQVFAEGVEIPYQAFEGARSYLTRVNFPRTAIVLAQSYESLITTLVRVIVVLIMIAVFHQLTVAGAALIIGGFFLTAFLGIGIGAILAPFMLLFADLHNTVKLILSYGLFLTPALYSPKSGELFSTVVNANPVSPLMHGVRDAAASGELGSPVSFCIVAGAAVFLVVAGFALLRMSSPILIERMLIGGR
jgi:lipopolysaccharide transport system permease protein